MASSANPPDPLDLSHLDAALALARRALGRCAPNPAVGCVLVREGRVVGRGWTQPGGRPHAETEALRRAGERARGATAYVSLEPCAHWGLTPPCADKLIEAGIARCVISREDPDPRVSGGGIAKLREAGIAVVLGERLEVANEVNEGFFLRISKGRPSVTLKLATTLDGHIATETGESRWITGESARRHTHLMRALHDAIMVGSGTALADNPRLDVRLPGLEPRSPLRVVLDGQLRLPPEHDLVTAASERPTLVLTRRGHSAERRAELDRPGLKIDLLPEGSDGRLEVSAALGKLGTRGINRLMVEGGAALAASLLSEDLVDTLLWYRAPIVTGAGGRSGVDSLGVERLIDARRFRRVATQSLGEDVLETYRRTPSASSCSPAS